MVRGSAFNQTDKLGNAHLRIDFAQQMNVVGHRFDLQNLRTGFFCHFLNQRFKPYPYLFREHFTPVLRAPDDVVPAAVRHVSVALPLRFQRHNIGYIDPMPYNTTTKSRRPYIPVAEARGLRPKFAKASNPLKRMTLAPFLSACSAWLQF